MKKKNIIQIKRIYEPPVLNDGYRILVDRLWPRGLKKENAPFDRWIKTVAPSTALRKWFAHDAKKWDAFSKKYKEELSNSDDINDLIACIQKHNHVTFLYAARDEKHNQAVVLRQFIEDILYGSAEIKSI